MEEPVQIVEPIQINTAEPPVEVQLENGGGEEQQPGQAKKKERREKRKKTEVLDFEEEKKMDDEPAIEVREQPKIDPLQLAAQIREENARIRR